MFRSPGLRTGTRILAILDGAGGLIVKLPRERALELIAAGVAEPVTMGRRTMREWVDIAPADDETATEETWTALAREALRFVGG